MKIMGDVVFWDVDTQIDFIERDGKLYVPGAENLKDNLKYLTRLGAQKTRLCGSVDAHLPDDPEFTEWPEHCVYGTPGQHKVTETLSEAVLFIPSVQFTKNQLSEAVGYRGQVIFEKQDIDVSTNPNVKPFVELVKPDLVIIYGFVSEICVDNAVELFAGDLHYETVVVLDAIKELDSIKSKSCQSNWVELGVKLLNTSEVESLLNQN
jgi:nicotinamidase/pyrazinamidase